VLPLGLLAEGAVDFDVNGLTAPLETLAAAARASSVRVERHARLLFLKDQGVWRPAYPFRIANRSRRGKKPP
jgi:hypothetical protein